jgi:hypothetical protein
MADIKPSNSCKSLFKRLEILSEMLCTDCMCWEGTGAI